MRMLRAGGRGGRSGVVLVLVSGIVTLLLAVCLLALRVGRIAAAGAAGVQARAQAALVAQSGMEYAAGRLLRVAHPRFSVTAADRGDDWAERQGSGISGQGSENPSYDHGEAWIDTSFARDGIDNDGDDEIDEPSEPDRIHVAGEAFRDADGDGRRSAWSGRLRAGRGTHGGRFALKVDALEGRIPLNGGYLSDHPEKAALQREIETNGLDDDGDGSVDEPGEGDGIAYASSGLDGSYHAGLAQVLNHLGERLSPALAALGSSLIQRRPEGGYRSWAEAKEAFLSDLVVVPLGTEEALESVRPFIDLGPYDAQSGRGVPLSATSGYVPVGLWTAPREILEAIWTGLEADSPIGKIDFAGEPEGWAKVSPHDGRPFAPPPLGAPLALWPAEAAALADFAILHRQRSRSLTWEGLRKGIAERSDRLFKEDFDALAAGAPTPVFQWSWVVSKAALAYQAVCESPCLFTTWQGNVVGSSSLWGSGGIDGNPEIPGIQVPHAVSFAQVRSKGRTSPFYPQGLTLAPPVRFSVESRSAPPGPGGGAVSCAGTVRVAERIALSTQEDFDLRGSVWISKGPKPPRPGPPALPGMPGRMRQHDPVPPGRGWSVVDDPSSSARRSFSGFEGPQVATLPGIDLRWFPDLWTPRSTLAPYVAGAIAPATIREERGDAQLYASFTETYDPDPAPPRPLAGLWTEYDPAPTPMWDPAKPLPPYLCVPAKELCDSTSGAPDADPASLREGWFYRGGEADVADPVNPGHMIQWPGSYPLADTSVWPYKPLYTQGSIQVRLGVNGGIFLRAQGAYLRILTSRAWRPSSGGGRWGTVFTFEMRGWPARLYASGTSSVWQEDILRSWWVPDDAIVNGWSYPVLLTIEKLGTGVKSKPKKIDDPFRNRYTLNVNGSSLSGDGPMEAVVDGAILAVGTVSMYFRCADEIRLYNHIASPVAGAGRYVRQAIYTSPLYVLDGSSAMRQVQWSGTAPPGLELPIQVSVIGYRDASGIGLPLPLSSCPLGDSSEVTDLVELGMPSGLRSFRYMMVLASEETVGEPPLFESIWFHVQRAGSAPAWSAWESR